MAAGAFERPLLTPVPTPHPDRELSLRMKYSEAPSKLDAGERDGRAEATEQRVTHHPTEVQ